jgi:hypothetical protein
MHDAFAGFQRCLQQHVHRDWAVILESTRHPALGRKSTPQVRNLRTLKRPDAPLVENARPPLAAFRDGGRPKIETPAPDRRERSRGYTRDAGEGDARAHSHNRRK